MIDQRTSELRFKAAKNYFDNNEAIYAANFGSLNASDFISNPGGVLLQDEEGWLNAIDVKAGLPARFGTATPIERRNAELKVKEIIKFIARTNQSSGGTTVTAAFLALEGGNFEEGGLPLTGDARWIALKNYWAGIESALAT